MNAKEKALELVNKYVAILQENYGTAVAMVLAKQCAIIAVDEILNIVSTVKSELFWKQVKTEIEKL